MYGTMIPLAAMELARHSHAPGLTSLLAGWCHNPRVRDLDSVPGSEFDPILLDLACEGRDMTWPFKYAMKRGDVTVGFSSGAQIDAVGNLNTVAIGPFEQPKVRLVGPILVPEHYALFGREIVMMPRHDTRVFVERVDYVAAVGFPEGTGAPRRARLPRRRPRADRHPPLRLRLHRRRAASTSPRSTRASPATRCARAPASTSRAATASPASRRRR